MSLIERNSIHDDHYFITHWVNAELDGIRLDQFLKSRYQKRSRQALQRVIERGVVQVIRAKNSFLGRIKPGLTLFTGDQVVLRAERKPEPEVNFNYSILFEDESILVINKPPHLPVHPAGRFFYNTLLVHLQRSKSQPLSKNPTHTPPEFFLPHRIDKETSGVMVLAKTKESCAFLTHQFATRETQKIYLAIVQGIPPLEFEVHEPMGRSQTSLIGLKMEILPLEKGGLPAATLFKRLKVTSSYSLVRAYPKTGRQHQIRVHLAHAGYPILGDKLYGLPEPEALQWFNRETLTPDVIQKLILPRHALHAESLTFIHPQTKQNLTFSAPLSEDLENFLTSVTNESLSKL